jgi:hypothetical protein
MTITTAYTKKLTDPYGTRVLLGSSAGGVCADARCGAGNVRRCG